MSSLESRLTFVRLRGVTFYKIELFIDTDVRTSNPSWIILPVYFAAVPIGYTYMNDTYHSCALSTARILRLLCPCNFRAEIIQHKKNRNK
jgi:hypothetical protein